MVNNHGLLQDNEFSHVRSYLKSGSGNTIHINFVNQCADPLQIDWVNFEGQKQTYNTLAAGDSYNQQTFATHPWVLVRNGQEFACYTAPTSIAANTQVTVTVQENGQAYVLGCPTAQNNNQNDAMKFCPTLSSKYFLLQIL